MKQEDYPEKIYALRIRHDGGDYYYSKQEEYITQEYTRSDLIEELLNIEFSRGIIEGERMAWEDIWEIDIPEDEKVKLCISDSRPYLLFYNKELEKWCCQNGDIFKHNVDKWFDI